MLKLKRIAIDAYGENIAYLSRDCVAYRAEEFQALAKIEVFHKERRINAVLNVVDNASIVDTDELGLSEHAFARLGLAAGTRVRVAQATRPESLESVRAKIAGAPLSPEAIGAIIRDITDKRYSKMEIAAFLVASAGSMSDGEILALTRAMAQSGTRLAWPEPLVVDKHSIGGIPGNRTSMIIVPIVAAHGLLIPKTSSRAITSAAGTADAMEVLCRVDLDVETMRSVVGRARGCLAWGGHVNLSPADEILISVERPLAVDTREQMVASILSKKLAAGSTHLVIDIPVGPTAKVRSTEEARRLCKLFESIGKRVGLTLEVMVTDGSQPIGGGIGPLLEAREAMAVLRNDAEAPQDLREKAITLAGRILEFGPGLEAGEGERRARALLRSGAALKAMERIVDAQGRRETEPPLGKLTFDVPSPRHGIVEAIDCYRIGRIARLAGAPLEKGAGIRLFRKTGAAVEAGEPLYRIHAGFPADFEFARSLAEEDSGYRIGEAG
jgi:thymidine phosphorylase